MNYQELFRLKYQEGYSTVDLAKKFPNDISRVAKIALLDVSEDTLRKVVKKPGELKQLLNLKKLLF